MNDPTRRGPPGTWQPDSEMLRRLRRRALALWPRLDRRALSRCRGDACIVSQVAHRTSMPPETIRLMLTGDKRAAH